MPQDWNYGTDRPGDATIVTRYGGGVLRRLFSTVVRVNSNCDNRSGKRMGKGRDKRRRTAKKQNIATRAEIARAYTEAEAALRRRNPPALEPDAPVLAPLKPKPNPRSGAVALPQPESDGAFSIVMPRRGQ
jgi:hypothetical protein